MTGTPLDLTPFGPLLKGLGHLYWFVALGIVLLALWWPKRWWLKLTSAAVVSAVVVYPLFVRPVEQRVSTLKAEEQQARARFEAAKAVFDERCKSAGEKISRTVENVEGVVWMKWRDKYDVNDDFDQFKLFDPYGRDCTGEDCIKYLLRLDAAGGRFDQEVKQRQGRYRFVESVDPSEGKRHRYTLTMALPPTWTAEVIAEFKKNRGSDPPDYSHQPKLIKQPIEMFGARYGITWDDISTREDREHWIAGGALKIIDLRTNEIIAERVGFMMDPGLGSRAGFRTPWALARRMACPAFPGGMYRHPTTDNVLFVLNVLKPVEEK